MSEAVLQSHVTRMLRERLDSSVWWTASLAGINLTRFASAKAKGQGLNRGWPDLQFHFPDGVTRYIELKTETGSLSPEQRAFRDRCADGTWALCRSVSSVVSTLESWGARLRPDPWAAANDVREAA